jgi:N-acetylneuraminic acid mutarotase
MRRVQPHCLIIVFVLAGSACGSSDAAPDDADSADSVADAADSADLGDTGDSFDAGLDQVGTDTVDVPDAGDGTSDTSDTSDSDATNGPSWGWERVGDLPTVLQEHSVLALDGGLYLLGGFENLTLVSAVRTWSPESETFGAGPDLPRPLHHLNAAAADRRLWVLGSLEGFNFSATADSWVLDPDAATPAWLPVSAMPSSRRRGSASMAVVGTDVYVLGGFRGGAVAECDVYRTGLDRWDALPPLPEARDHAGAASIDGKVYLVGGRQGAIGSVEADLWRFDPNDAEAGWVAMSPMPTARGGIAVGVVAGLGGAPRLVVVGGEGNAAADSGVFAQVEAYDPATDTWESLPPMPAPRHGMQAVGIGSRLFVPGGADVEAFGATKRFDVLRFVVE